MNDDGHEKYTYIPQHGLREEAALRYPVLQQLILGKDVVM